jgi:hypothetical protein
MFYFVAQRIEQLGLVKLQIRSTIPSGLLWQLQLPSLLQSAY